MFFRGLKVDYAWTAWLAVSALGIEPRLVKLVLSEARRRAT